MPIDSLVSRKGDWLFNANSYLKYSSKEDWSAPKPGSRTSMQDLINIATSYLDLFSDKFVKTPWGRPSRDWKAAPLHLFATDPQSLDRRLTLPATRGISDIEDDIDCRYGGAN